MQYYLLYRSFTIFNQSMNQLEAHRCKGSLVGRLLGAYGVQHEEMLEEGHRQGYLRDGRTEHCTCGGVESIINYRPLTYVHDDQEGISFALTPFHLIYGRQITSTPNATHYEVMSTCMSLTKRVNYHQRLLEQFTNHWRKEHL